MPAHAVDAFLSFFFACVVFCLLGWLFHVHVYVDCTVRTLNEGRLGMWVLSPRVVENVSLDDDCERRENGF